MTLISPEDTEFLQKKKKSATLHNFFVIESLTDNDKPLNEHDLKEKPSITRCIKCGYPLGSMTIESGVALQKEKKRLFKPKTGKSEICFACRRERLLSFVLNASYVISSLLFIAAFVGVFFKVITLDFCLLIGCLEIIFLMFFGRFLEEAVFFGLSAREKILATLYRYSITGELQNFDAAFSYLPKIDCADDEMLRALLQVTIFQAKELPISWFLDLSKFFKTTPHEVVQLLSEQINEEQEKSFLKNLVENAPPAGMSLLIEILLLTNNNFGLQIASSQLEHILKANPFDNSWRDEFFIYKEKYLKALTLAGREDMKELLLLKMQDYKEPKVPTIDVLESSKNFIQRNPIFRYLFRILLYLLLAFLFGLFYKLLD
ncbi:MAG: hypothetical protein K9W42_04405 [Candidatus Heimdallarchaeota archaeon]|nr:hypothetical protein [Candidatus Heimdallarchaeota archaeon]